VSWESALLNIWIEFFFFLYDKNIFSYLWITVLYFRGTLGVSDCLIISCNIVQFVCLSIVLFCLIFLLDLISLAFVCCYFTNSY
jgi:hypothetical protein